MPTETARARAGKISVDLLGIAIIIRVRVLEEGEGGAKFDVLQMKSILEYHYSVFAPLNPRDAIRGPAQEG